MEPLSTLKQDRAVAVDTNSEFRDATIFKSCNVITHDYKIAFPSVCSGSIFN
jgi:hypothetical protein